LSTSVKWSPARGAKFEIPIFYRKHHQVPLARDAIWFLQVCVPNMRENTNLLWYRRPAFAWQEALPIGNGRLGAMVFGSAGRERIQLNEDTFWTGSSYDPVNPRALRSLPALRGHLFNGAFDAAERLATADFLGTPAQQATFQPVGDLIIEHPNVDEHALTAYRRQLDLDSGLLSVMYESKGTTFVRTVLASPDRQVIAVNYKATRPGQICLNLMVEARAGHSSMRIDENGTITVSGRNPPRNGLRGGLTFVMRFRAVAHGGTVEPDDDILRVKDADEVTIFIAIATSFIRYDDVTGNPEDITRNQLEQAVGVKFDQLALETSESHRALFRRVSIDLGHTPQSFLPTDQRVKANAEGAPDPGLAALYFQFGRYLLIACSRPGNQPANLQGLWNDAVEPAWGSKYTININTQMNYWPAETTNLPELALPLFDLIKDLSETGRKTARDMYGARGWCVHHNTDIWRATAPVDAPRFGLWTMAGAWLCRHLWDHYDYGRDLDFLRSVYPIIRSACLFYLDMLIVDPKDGSLVTIPSMSPENDHGRGDTSLCVAPTMDMQVMRDLFTNAIEAGTLLGLDQDLREELVEKRSRLRPTAVGGQGQIMEWRDDWDSTSADPHHRHVSHLYELYPGNEITVDRTPDLAEAAKVTLHQRGPGGTGWSTAWKINLWARLRDSREAYQQVQHLLSPELCYPNLFDVHPPLATGGSAVFQIDGNLGGTAGIAEMLVQSLDSVILLLPALPAEWPEGHIDGIRVKGAMVVSVVWSGGVLSRMEAVSAVQGVREFRYQQAVRIVELDKDMPVRLYGPDLKVLE
jgi:alpha-L-fucosidase 2